MRGVSPPPKFHLLNLLSMRNLRTVLNPGQLARAPSSKGNTQLLVTSHRALVKSDVMIPTYHLRFDRAGF